MGKDNFTIVAEGGISSHILYLGADGSIYNCHEKTIGKNGVLTSFTGAHHLNSYNKCGFEKINSKGLLPKVYSSFLIDFPKEEFPDLYKQITSLSKAERSLDLIGWTDDTTTDPLFLDDSLRLFSLATDQNNPTLPLIDPQVANNVSFFREVPLSSDAYEHLMTHFGGSGEQYKFLQENLMPFLNYLSPLNLKNKKWPASVQKKLQTHIDVSSGNKISGQFIELNNVLYTLVPGLDVPLVNIGEQPFLRRNNVLQNEDLTFTYLPLDMKNIERITALSDFSEDQCLELCDRLAFSMARNSRFYHLIPSSLENNVNSHKSSFLMWDKAVNNLHLEKMNEFDAGIKSKSRFRL